MDKMVLFSYSQETQVTFQTVGPRLKQQSNMSLNPKQESVADPVSFPSLTYMPIVCSYSVSLISISSTASLRLKDVCKLESTFYKGKLCSPDSNEPPWQSSKVKQAELKVCSSSNVKFLPEVAASIGSKVVNQSQ